MPSGVNLRLLEQKFAKLEAKERKLSLQQGKNGTTWKLVGLRSGAGGAAAQQAAVALSPRHDEEVTGETLYSGVEDLKTRSRGGKAVAADEERAKRQMQRDFISGATFAKARAQTVMQECVEQREGVQKAQQREDDVTTNFTNNQNRGACSRSNGANQLPGLFDNLLASIDHHSTNNGDDDTNDHDDGEEDEFDIVEEVTPISRHPKQGARVPSPSVEVMTSRSLGESIRAPMRPALDVNTLKGARAPSASSKTKGDFWGMPSPNATTPSVRPHTSGSVPTAGPRVQGGGGASPSYLSRYKNPHPVNIPRRPMTSSSHTRTTATTNIGPDGRRDENATATATKGNQSALASLANLRRILAPAIGLPPPPKKPSKFAAKRVLQRPATANGTLSTGAGGGVVDPASDGGRMMAVRDHMHDMRIAYPHVPIEALHKDYYYLHIRVVHQSNLQGWVFTVVLTDATHQQASSTSPPGVNNNEDRSVPLTPVTSAATGSNNTGGAMRHTINGVRCNEHKYLVFHPPSGIVLSPSDDIPWVPNAPFLYQRTLRVEVYATQPTKAKVVDMMVKFGNAEE